MAPKGKADKPNAPPKSSARGGAASTPTTRSQSNGATPAAAPSPSTAPAAPARPNYARALSSKHLIASNGPVAVYSLPLESDGSPSKERGYVRLPAPATEPYILRLTIDAGSAATKHGVLHTNFPLDDSDFERSKFHQRDLPSDLSKPVEIDLIISKSGAFEFFIDYDDGKGQRKQSTHCYFNVDPVIRLASRSPILDPSTSQPLPVGQGGTVQKDGEPAVLPVNGLVIQSVIAKWLGPLVDWPKHLDTIRDRGYNMIHFAPLQQRGQSGSPYSLYDQLTFDRELFGPEADTLSTEQKTAEVNRWVARLRDEWGILSLIDVVLNHTADNTDWLQDHPEAGYNPLNSPHLEAAVVVDTALYEFGLALESHGLPSTIATEDDLRRVMDVFREQILPKTDLWQFYVADVAAGKRAFAAAWAKPAATANGTSNGVASLDGMDRRGVLEAFTKRCLPEDWSVLSGRFGLSPDIGHAVAFVRQLVGEHTDAGHAEHEYGRLLDDLNVDRYAMYNSDVESILSQTTNRIKYQRIDAHGPRIGKVTKDRPLVDTYFIHLPKNERTAKHDPRSLALATNGWIWDANPLVDFASSATRAYVRREVIGWGDCVKLRYGAKPADSPFLWSHMTKYVESLAEQFAGFRIDNCHSTPMHVGEHMLDAARRVNPNLYVCAELFTGSEAMDVHFVSRLGINSLIREAMNGGDPKDMSRLLYIYGLGKPVASMDGACLTEAGTVVVGGKTRPCSIVQLTGSTPHTFMMDCTHDNESPLTKRTAEDALSTGALVAMGWSSVGSNKGYDDLYPKLLDLVHDSRRYATYDRPDTSGISLVKRVLNHLHAEMAVGGYIEGHLHQEGDYIVSSRIHPQTHRGYVVVAHCAFPGSGQDRGHAPSITLRQTKATFVLGARLDVRSHDDPSDEQILRGLDAELVMLEAPAMHDKTDGEGAFVEVVVPDRFPAGSVMILATEMSGLSDELDTLCLSGAKEAFAELDMVDLNLVLFRADGEERDATGGQDGVYAVPGMAPLVYCGLEGWMHPLRHIMLYNDLGHPLCAHLRDGPWPLDYVVGRLEKQTATFPRVAKPAQWFKERFDAVRAKTPPFMRPRYFAMIVNEAYKAARDRVFEQCSPFIRDGHNFTQALALCACQMYGRVKSASLDPGNETASLAAGLPHFTAGWARCWGRDVFISLRGLFLTTGQFEAARQHILAFASTLKHGLIPNLLDSIRMPRYNSRDSPWWMVQNIQDYCATAPEGLALLSVPVKRRFPADDTWVAWDDERAYAYSSTVAEVVQEILQRHATGIHFREYNAGPNLDSQMSDRGFDIDIDVDWSTGIIGGGSEFNCGTWMDKMGESERAGTRGKPGTPRDGAPIEIIGLLKSTLRWLDALSGQGKFPFKGVDAVREGKKTLVTYKEWSDLLQASFERCFYIPMDAVKDGEYRLDSALVARRGIYKDVFGTGAGREKADYQLRANFPIAMAVAPELFDPQHALGALRIYEDVLVGPLGVKTLDPHDSDYRGYYDNSRDDGDPATSKGRNYHQGPEWGWPAGYFLRALLHFDTLVGEGKKDPDATIHRMQALLLARREHIRKDPWAGLPELTNENGQLCHDSCDTQAWSASTILDALEDVYKLKQKA